jgi:hypothetical protein
MEASERQLPMDAGAGDGVVRALDDRVLIERLTVQDERAAQLVRERQAVGQEPAKTVADAIEIGARVLDREDAAVEADYVRAEFERQAGSLRERLARSLEDGDRQLAERIAKSFDGAQEGSVQRQVSELVSRALIEQRTSLVKLFSAEDGANPLTDFKGAVVRALKQSDERHTAESQESRQQIEQLTRELVELKERQAGDERVAEAEQAGTRKGRSFEERVHEVIEAIATGRGDAAMAVGDLPGETRGKKGDTVVEIGAAQGATLAKIAFDPKDSSNLTRPKAWEVLNGSLDDRGADYAVLVVAGEDTLPAKTQSLVEYEGNKLIVAVDREEPERFVLETAYCLARARALAAREDELSFDCVAMKEAVEEARRALESLKTARQALTGMRKNADSIESALATVEEGTKGALARVDGLIAEAMDTAA